ncbi:MAG: aspartate aminotransferase family protein [Verrucomicrobiota bacterium]|jgi:4-aminobutyrate aminotransferase-like enzyme|nr:aspartate aminotransferase family protein [Verrucomicrobiota bacterium]
MIVVTMGKEFSTVPQSVPLVETKHRRICTQVPHPDSVPLLDRLREVEPLSMRGMPPIIWDKAQDIYVFDKHGNQWLDWSSGVLVTNAGHAAPEICQAMIDQIQSGLIHNYVFPSEERLQAAEIIASVSPDGLKKVFLLSSGSEATECAIKLSRANGIKVGGPSKIGIIGFDRGYHGRTLASQQAGGMAGQKSWIVNLDKAIIQAPFPDGYWEGDSSFDAFLQAIEKSGMKPENIAGVIMESYQGVGPDFAPVEYIQKLRAWCDEHQVVLTFDEVQSGFGRTGKFWAFEHYGVTPDLICCGKGISSGMPLSAVIGRQHIMDQFPPGSMTSTHTGNPVCCAAAVANIKKLLAEDLTGNAAKLGPILHERCKAIQKRHPNVVGHVTCAGLVAGLQMVKPGQKEPNHDLAHRIIELCFQRGLLLFAPVGAWGQTVKICPPLTVTEEALLEACDVLDMAVDDAVREKSA